MKSIKAYTLKLKTKERGVKSIGELSVGQQVCYNSPTVLLTFEDENQIIEMQLPPEICEDLARLILEHGKNMLDEV